MLYFRSATVKVMALPTRGPAYPTASSGGFVPRCWVETDGAKGSAARGKESKAWVCGSSLTGVESSKCVVRYKSLLRADQSSRGVVPSMVCLRVIVKP